MARNRASDISAADWLSQTQKIMLIFSLVVIQLLLVVKIPIRHSSLFNKYLFYTSNFVLRFQHLSSFLARREETSTDYTATVCSLTKHSPSVGLSFKQLLKSTEPGAVSRELKQPRRQRQKDPHKFAYLTMKNKSFARFARAFFIF